MIQFFQDVAVAWLWTAVGASALHVVLELGFGVGKGRSFMEALRFAVACYVGYAVVCWGISAALWLVTG